MAIIDKPSDYFNTKLYTGDGTNPRAITGVGFQPDWVWNKPRSAANSHALLDSVRGATKFLSSDVTDAEYTYGHSIQSFDSDGFTCGDNASFNQNGTTYASWNWKANGAGVSNTDGTISSTVSANTTSGFSIVSWTGNGTDNATVGHGLSQKPDMVIIKARENTSSWVTWHKDLTGSDYCMFLDGSDAQSQYSTILKNQSASLLTLGTNSASNANTQGFISYNFHSVQGFSKFGSYTGNGNSDGTFVYTGFKPAFVIMKRTDTTENWLIKDSVRDSFNVADKRLFANLSQAEGTSANGSIDILSNGFKQRGSDIITNASGGTYIYMAFASSPFTTSSGVPTTAR
jgi:hypothetical protein